MTRNLYFEHGNGRVELIATDVAEKDVIRAIQDYVKQLNPNYKIYYIRTWDISKTATKCDVGSWSEFFYWGYDGNDT